MIRRIGLALIATALLLPVMSILSVALLLETSCADRSKSGSTKRLEIKARDVFIGSRRQGEVDRTDSYTDTVAFDLKTYFPSCPVVLSQDALRADYRLSVTFEEDEDHPGWGVFRATVVRKNGDIMFTYSEYANLADRSLDKALTSICQDVLPG
jgi:hypothetical protein